MATTTIQQFADNWFEAARDGLESAAKAKRLFHLAVAAVEMDVEFFSLASDTCGRPVDEVAAERIAARSAHGLAADEILDHWHRTRVGLGFPDEGDDDSDEEIDIYWEYRSPCLD